MKVIEWWKFINFVQLLPKPLQEPYPGCRLFNTFKKLLSLKEDVSRKIYLLKPTITPNNKKEILKNKQKYLLKTEIFLLLNKTKKIIGKNNWPCLICTRNLSPPPDHQITISDCAQLSSRPHPPFVHPTHSHVIT